MSDAFRTVLDMSLTACLVILLVLAGRFLLRRNPKVYSYALWSVVLFRLLCPVSFSSPVSVVRVSQSQVIVRSEVATSISYFPEAEREQPDVLSEVEPLQQKKESRSFLDMASWIWGIGVLSMAGYAVYSYWMLRFQLIGAVMNQTGIYSADHIPSAFVVGLLCPRIYLPAGLSEQEEIYILAHENCHIRRGDHVIKLLAYAAVCLHWFNPLVWLAFKLAGKDMEMSCDEAVLKRMGERHRGDYAQVLLQQAAGSRRNLSVLSFGEGDTKGRVRNMANWKKPTPWIVILSVLLCWIIISACALNPSGQETGFGVWMGEGECEDLTQEAYTAYLNQTYGLSQLIDHKVYYQDGFFQVDMLFEEDTQNGQWKSGLHFAVDKFWHRNHAEYDFYNYDLWLMDHADERTRGLLYRCFADGKLQMLVSYPVETFLSETVH